jgi:hypothetical protein
MSYENLAVTFILLVLIIIATKSLTDAALIMSLLVYVFILSNTAGKLGRKDPESLETPETKPTTGSAEPAQAQAPVDITKPMQVDGGGPDTLYGRDHTQYMAYTDVGNTGWTGTNLPQTFGTVYSAHVDIPNGTTLGVDQATVELARRRARDRQAIEGQNVKDVNYYRYHFAGELDEAEKRRWWGNHEY